MVNPITNTMGLFDCISILKSDLAVIHPLKIFFHAEGIREEDLGERLQLNIYRIIQEQVNNILKHSKATKATINLSKRGDEIILLISDNGRGYDTTKLRKGRGILNIISRADLLHGKAEVNSKTGKGYQLKVELPFEGLSKKEKYRVQYRCNLKNFLTPIFDHSEEIKSIIILFLMSYLSWRKVLLILAQTSIDNQNWEKEAGYEYYLHEPLGRTVIGHTQLQGVEYAYTIQGWLKGIYSTGGTSEHDIGEDTKIVGAHQFTAEDAYALTLNYFGGDS